MSAPALLIGGTKSAYLFDIAPGQVWHHKFFTTSYHVPGSIYKVEAPMSAPALLFSHHFSSLFSDLREEPPKEQFVSNQELEPSGEELESCRQPMTEREAEMCREISGLRLRLEALREQSVRDPLTGLFNRRYMEESLEREFHLAHRYGTTVGIILCDIDDFKRFNDTFGHAAGDLILERVGNLIHAFTRKSDTACRYGGEELVVIMPRANLEAACRRAEHLRQTVKQLQIEHHDQPLGVVTLSAGVAVFPEHGESSSSVMRAADAALYRAKAQGRDRVLCP
jgi:diguanylate cyclase (GGDEF)-like protein